MQVYLICHIPYVDTVPHILLISPLNEEKWAFPHLDSELMESSSVLWHLFILNLLRLSVYFNKLPDIINVFLLFYKEIQSKSKVKANSKEHTASEWQDILPISHLGSMSLPVLSAENNKDNFLWTLLRWRPLYFPKIIFDKQKLHIVSNSVNHFMKMNYVLTRKKEKKWKDAIWKLFGISKGS